MLVYQCTHWVEMHANREVWLSYEFDEAGVTYRDSRFRESGEVLNFGPLHARIQRSISDRIVAVDELCAEWTDVSPENVIQAIAELDRARLVFREGNRLLGLAMPASCYERWRARAKQLDKELATA